MKMLEPEPNYPGERVRFDDLEPPAPRDQISGVEPAYAKPARPGIGDRVKGWAKETQYRLKEKTAETLRRAEEARRERREYDKARAAFASANRVKMDRSVDTRFWINDEYYIDVDVRYPEAVAAAQKEIQRIRRMVKAQQRPPSGAPGHQPGPYREPPQRRQPSFDFIAGTGGGGPPSPAPRPPSDAPGLSFVAGGARPLAAPSRRPQERPGGMGHLTGFLSGGQRQQPQPQQRKPAARKKSTRKGRKKSTK
jgi:hypothetical protein